MRDETNSGQPLIGDREEEDPHHRVGREGYLVGHGKLMMVRRALMLVLKADPCRPGFRQVRGGGDSSSSVSAGRGATGRGV